MPDFYIVCSFFHKKSKQARVPTFVLLFPGDATSEKGPVCDEGTNECLRDFAVVPLMPTRVEVLEFGIESGGYLLYSLRQEFEIWCVDASMYWGSVAYLFFWSL